MQMWNCVRALQKEITEQTQNMQLIDLEEELAAELERDDAEQPPEAAEQMESGEHQPEAPAPEQLQQQEDELNALASAANVAAFVPPGTPVSASGVPGQPPLSIPSAPEQNLIIRKDYNPKGTHQF